MFESCVPLCRFSNENSSTTKLTSQELYLRIMDTLLPTSYIDIYIYYVFDYCSIAKKVDFFGGEVKQQALLVFVVEATYNPVND